MRTPIRLGVAVVVSSVAILQACSVRTEEERRQDTNARLAPEAEIASDKSVTVRWPDFVNHKGAVVAEAVTLTIPARFRPEPHREWPYSSSPRIESVSLTVAISGIKPWETPPPIHPEIYDGPRLYSALNPLFGKEPDSMANPETRAKFEAWRERARSYKRVHLQRNHSLATAEQKHWLIASAYRVLHDVPPGPENKGIPYLRDGEVGGLRRYSKLYCYSVHQQREPHYARILEHKRTDDPSPTGCVVNRDLAMYVSAPGNDDWVLIECRAYGICDAYFQAGRREARTSIWIDDVQRWQETVSPVRAVVDSLVTLPATER